jgi:aquaporin Z
MFSCNRFHSFRIISTTFHGRQAALRDVYGYDKENLIQYQKTFAYPPIYMNYRAYIAEFLGAATLTLAVLVTISSDLALATPLAAGLTLAIFVYTIGPISGSHINPAVTVGLFSIGKIKLNDAVGYIVAQIAGGLLAWQLVSLLGLTVPSVVATDSLAVAFGEFAGAFLLLFGICSVVFGKVSDVASGLVIGGSLLLGILIAASFSNGVLNPAVALGIGSVSATYFIAPLVGGIAAAHLYRWIAR